MVINNTFYNVPISHNYIYQYDLVKQCFAQVGRLAPQCETDRLSQKV